MIPRVEQRPPERFKRARRRRGSSRVWWALALSLLVHLCFVGGLVLSSHLTPPPPPPPRPVSMRTLSAEQWARNRSASPSRSSPNQVKPTPPKEEKKKPEERPQGQVVAVAPGNQEESPDAKYLAESANKVKKETRAREQTPNYQTPQPQRTEVKPQPSPANDSAQSTPVEGSAESPASAEAKKSGAKKSVMELPEARKRSELALKKSNQAGARSPDLQNRSKSEDLQGNAKRLRIEEGGEEGGSASPGAKGRPGRLNLMPSAATMERIAGAAANDALDEEEGDGTFLNTREWKYSSFFNRVKQSVGMHWNPSTLLHQRDPSGSIYSGKSRFTQLAITLDPQGRVRDISVEESSGLDFLDVEAVRSFEEAQPFPNPPPGLASSDSMVRFRFGFSVDMGGGPRMRIFRQD